MGHGGPTRHDVETALPRVVVGPWTSTPLVSRLLVMVDGRQTRSRERSEKLDVVWTATDERRGKERKAGRDADGVSDGSGSASS